MFWVLAALAWQAPNAETGVSLSPQWQPDQAPVTDAAHAVSWPSLGVHLWLRPVPAPKLALGEQALLDSEEATLALSPDRLARAMQRERPELSTHYIGPSEQGAHVGRWVFEHQDAHGTWLSWQLLWQAGSGQWYQLLAQAPREHAAPVATLMRQVESQVWVSTPPPPALMVKKIRSTCPPDRHLTRSQVLSGSSALQTASEVLGSATDPTHKTLAELRLMGLLYRNTEGCLRQVSEASPLCRVVESPAQSPQDHLLVEQVRACVDADPELRATLEQVVEGAR
ncbi:MAG: hypothetical protein VX899_13690 [Myxococcota bacterium]|nr:hypothetical protein [Myxococcota bacterium]